jgi:hypothetical protein
MKILSFISSIFKPVTDLIDKGIVDKDKANELRAALYAAEAQLAVKVIEYEEKLVQAQADAITTEAKGESWLQRNWRPVTMLTFVVLVVARWLGFADSTISEAVELELMTLIQIGLGGYVVGRSVEKVLPKVAEIVKSK